MTIGVLAALVFLAVTAGVVGVYMLVIGRSQAAREKTIEYRLSELGGSGPAEEAAERRGLARSRAGSRRADADVDRVARRPCKGSRFERRLEQSGMKLTVSACILISLALGVGGALVGVMFSHKCVGDADRVRAGPLHASARS